MDTKEIHESYKKLLNEMFSDEYKKALIEAAVKIFGEEYRQQFERNMEKIIIHPKVNLKDLPKEGRNIEEVKEIEETALEELSNEEEKDIIKKEQIANQKELLIAIKSKLKPDDAEKLQEIIDKCSFNGSFVKQTEDSKELDDKFLELFGDDEPDKTLLNEIIEKYKLYSPEESIQFANEIPEIKEYWEKQRKTVLSRYSNYEELQEELKDYDLSDIEAGLDAEFTDYSGSFVIPLKNNNTNEYEYHVFIDPISKDQKSEICHVLTHEVLHAEEYIEKEIDGETCIKTGHNDFEKNGEKDSKFTLLSEMFHEMILMYEIDPELKEKGIEIKASPSDYLITIDNKLVDFYFKYREQILKTACQEDNKELTNIIGEENWEDLADVVHKSKEEQAELVNKITQDAKEKEPTEIEKDNNLSGERKNVVKKETLIENYENISANERKEETRKISEMIRREQELKNEKQQNGIEI